MRTRPLTVASLVVVLGCTSLLSGCQNRTDGMSQQQANERAWARSHRGGGPANNERRQHK